MSTNSIYPQFTANFFDGVHSNAQKVTVHLEPSGYLHLLSESINRRIHLAEVKISSRLGNTARYLTFDDGGKLETNDNDSVDRLLTHLPGGHRHGLLHAVERHWGRVIAALVITVAFCAWAVLIGLPWLADRTARSIPVELENIMGEQSMAALDAHLLAPTRLPELQRERARRLFAQVARDLELPAAPRLALRRADGIGPNAFALPSGIIVITDEMVEMADVDGELMAVIAHELGHVSHRHIMRSVLQNSAVALLLATMLGDVSSITGLAASIPTLLVEQGYSRSFEFEADDYAARWLDQAGMERMHLARALRKLGDAHGISNDEFSDYLSTHPGIERRIEAIAP